MSEDRPQYAANPIADPRPTNAEIAERLRALIWYAKAGAWENDYGVIRDVNHWRDVTPPTTGGKT